MKKTKPLLIFIICYLAYTAIYVARLNLTTATPEFLAQTILSQDQVGMIGSAFFVVYALGRIINGYIGDRTAPWIMIAGGLLLGGIGNIFIGLLPPFWGILVLWSVNAYAQSMLWSSVIRIVSDIYSLEKAKKMMSYMVTSVATGNIIGILLNTAIINRFGLGYAFIIPGSILLIMCAAICLTTRKVKPAAPEVKHMPLTSLAKDPKILSILAPTMFHGVMKDNISLWMTAFFVAQYAIDLEASAAFVLFIPVVGLIGRLAYPALYKLYKGKERALIIHAFLLCTVASVLLLFKTIPPVVAILCLSLIYAAISVINTYLLSMFPLQFAASGNQSSVSGIMDFFTYLGAGIGSFAFGYLIKFAGYGAMYLCFAVISVISVIIVRKKLS